MKVTLELPDWAEERRVIVLAGVECVAIKEPHGNWKVKETRCDQCGMCCADYPPTPYGVDEEGNCNMLKFSHEKWECRAGVDKPYRCLLDPIEKDIGCCITYKKG